MSDGDGGVLAAMADDLVADLRRLTDADLAILRQGWAPSPGLDALLRRLAVMAGRVLVDRDRLGRAVDRATAPPVEGWWSAKAASHGDDDGDPDVEVVDHWPDDDDATDGV